MKKPLKKFELFETSNFIIYTWERCVIIIIIRQLSQLSEKFKKARDRKNLKYFLKKFLIHAKYFENLWDIIFIELELYL